jgi:hypothetical protein
MASTPEQVKAWYNSNADYKIASVKDWRELNIEHRRSWEQQHKRKLRLAAKPPCAACGSQIELGQRLWCRACAAVFKSTSFRTSNQN